MFLINFNLSSIDFSFLLQKLIDLAIILSGVYFGFWSWTKQQNRKKQDRWIEDYVRNTIEYLKQKKAELQIRRNINIFAMQNADVQLQSEINNLIRIAEIHATLLAKIKTNEILLTRYYPKINFDIIEKQLNDFQDKMENVLLNRHDNLRTKTSDYEKAIKQIEDELDKSEKDILDALLKVSKISPVKIKSGFIF